MIRTSSMLVLLALTTPSLALAQERPPEECGMTQENAQYGVAPGTVVTLQRHRFVGGDDNWDDGMTRWVGRSGRVTQLVGVDDQGGPVVNIDADQGQYFWRVRDMTLP